MTALSTYRLWQHLRLPVRGEEKLTKECEEWKPVVTALGEPSVKEVGRRQVGGEGCEGYRAREEAGIEGEVIRDHRHCSRHAL